MWAVDVSLYIIVTKLYSCESLVITLREQKEKNAHSLKQMKR